jgi:hypothetical protein
MYVVVRARVLQLGAELAMLQDFMDSHLFQAKQTQHPSSLSKRIQIKKLDPQH